MCPVWRPLRRIQTDWRRFRECPGDWRLQSYAESLRKVVVSGPEKRIWLYDSIL